MARAAVAAVAEVVQPQQLRAMVAMAARMVVVLAAVDHRFPAHREQLEPQGRAFLSSLTRLCLEQRRHGLAITSRVMRSRCLIP